MNFLKLNDIKRLFSLSQIEVQSFAEKFNKTTRNLLKKPVFEKGNANWIDELPKVIKKYNNIYSSFNKNDSNRCFKKKK